MVSILYFPLPLFTFFFCLSIASARSPTSFCKCTCFKTNSTIIPLDAPRSPLLAARGQVLADFQQQQHQQPQSQPRSWIAGRRAEEGNGDDGRDGEKVDQGGDRKEFRAGNCNDCNRQYCLDARLPICKDAGVNDVFTACFQRDSRKDEAVVFIFIIATAGLLGWAAVKPWVGTWIDNARERRNYIPVANEADR